MGTRLLVVSLVVLSLAAVVWLVAGCGGGSSGAGAADTPQAAAPDLVIAKVKIEKIGSGDFFNWKYTIVVKNIGTAIAGSSKTTVYWIGDPSQNPTHPTGIEGSADTPAVPAGGSRTVTLTTPGAAGAPSLFRVVAADAPVPGKLLGQVSEGAVVGSTQPLGERNNFFGFPLNFSLGMPQVFVNPGAS